LHVRAAMLGILLAACDGNEGTCEGGGDPTAAIGVEEIVGEFVPYEDGDTLPVDDDGSGPELTFAYEITGLDATDTVGVVLRIGREGAGTTDYLANADLRCSESGPARYGAVAPWPATWPAPSMLDGTAITVDTAFTDVHAISAFVEVSLIVDASP